MSANRNWAPPEWLLARSDRNPTMPLRERQRRMRRLEGAPDPAALHNLPKSGSRITYSGLLPPEQEIRLRLREVNTMDVAVCREMKRRKELGLSTEALRPITTFLQQRMKLLRYERERLEDPSQPPRYRFLPGPRPKARPPSST